MDGGRSLVDARDEPDVALQALVHEAHTLADAEVFAPCNFRRWGRLALRGPLSTCIVSGQLRRHDGGVGQAQACAAGLLEHRHPVFSWKRFEL